MIHVLKKMQTGYKLETRVGPIHFTHENEANDFLDRLAKVSGRPVGDNELLAQDRRERPAGDLSTRDRVFLANSVKKPEQSRESIVEQMQAQRIAEMQQSETKHLTPSQRLQAIYEANKPKAQPQDAALVSLARQHQLLVEFDPSSTESDVIRASTGLRHAEVGNAEKFRELRDQIVANRQQQRAESRRQFEARLAEERARYEAEDKAFADAHGLEPAPEKPVPTYSHEGYLDQSPRARYVREQAWAATGWTPPGDANEQPS